MWHHTDFSRWQPWCRKSTSGCGFGIRVWPLRMSKSICIPNFDKISQYVAVLLLLPVSENKWPLYWNSTSGFDFDLFIIIGMANFTGVSNFIQIGQPTAELSHHIDFSRLQPFHHKSTSRCRFSKGTWWRRSKSILSAYKILMSYHSWVISTCGFTKQTSTTLVFYLRTMTIYVILASSTCDHSR